MVLHRWPRQLRPNRGSSQGTALLTAVFALFTLGTMLIAFEFFTRTDIQFASLNRNSIQALGVAEAGLQEALTPARLSGAVPGSTTFSNSLARTTAGSTGTVAYEGCFPGYCLGSPTIFPVLSTGTFAGARRKVRVIEQATFKPGFGTIFFGPSVQFSADASQFTGDLYAVGDAAGTGAPGGMTFQSYARSPRCATSDMAGTLLSPEVFSGTTIVLGTGGSGGIQTNTNCPPNLYIDNNGTFYFECAKKPTREVAPTLCLGRGNKRLVPYNWHPATPIGMPSSDFAAVVAAGQASTLPHGVSVQAATQSGDNVTYTSSGTYSPAYWRDPSRGPVLLIVALEPFCVDAFRNSVVTLNPPYPGRCPAGYAYYGASLNPGAPLTTRYLDWGLVKDDLSRQRATTFFQAPAVPASSCASATGNPCGIRYVPVMPRIDVIAQACLATVFVQLNTDDGAACRGGAPRHGEVTFTGTNTVPETLVIDNTGPQADPKLQVKFAPPEAEIASAVSCGQSNFDKFNAGIILAQGDITLAGDAVFSGFIYTTGTIKLRGVVTIRGGIFAATTPESGSAVDAAGTTNFCEGQGSALPLGAQFFDFGMFSWQEVPLNQP